MNRLTIPDVLEDFATYYARPENGAWGGLHIVLDDGNVSDDSIRFCIDAAEEEGDAETARLGRLLLRLTKTQRRKLPHIVWNVVESLRGALPAWVELAESSAYDTRTGMWTVVLRVSGG